MDQTDIIKEKIKERLKKLEEVKKRYDELIIKNKNNLHPTSSEYQSIQNELISKKLEYIEKIKNDLMNANKSKENNTDSNNSIKINNPIIKGVNPPNSIVKQKDNEQNEMKLPEEVKKIDVEKITQNSASNLNRETRQARREERMREARKSGCGCRKV